MRRLRAALVLALLAASAPGVAQDRQPGEVRLEIHAMAGWTETGVMVDAGDSLAITAAGTPHLPPGGYPGRRLEDAPAPDLPWGALIGRIGGGPPFLIGGSYAGKAAAAGSLLISLNFGEQGVRASLPVVVRHERAPPPDPIPDPEPEPVEANLQTVATNLTEAVDNGFDEEPVEANLQTAATNFTEAVDNGFDEAVAAPPSPTSRPRLPERPERSSRPGDGGGGLGWLAGAALMLALAAAAGAVAARKVGRARAVERTRALLIVSPSLDPGEGACGADDVPAEGPAASVRARLEPGAARMAEGAEHG